MAQNKNNSVTNTAEKTLETARIFNAPRELVWKVWTDPKHVVNWWGPKDFTSPFCKIDLRPGGTFHFCMRSPEGKNYWNKGEYLEIVAPEKIVSKMYFSDKGGNKLKPTDYGIGADFPLEMLDTVTFEVYEGNKTKFTLRRNTPESISKRYMEDKGWNESLDKFAEELAKT